MSETETKSTSMACNTCGRRNSKCGAVKLGSTRIVSCSHCGNTLHTCIAASTPTTRRPIDKLSQPRVKRK